MNDASIAADGPGTITRIGASTDTAVSVQDLGGHGRGGLARLGWVRLEPRTEPVAWRGRPWVIMGPYATVLSHRGEWIAEQPVATATDAHLEDIRWSDQQKARNFFRDWMRRNTDRYRA